MDNSSQSHSDETFLVDDWFACCGHVGEVLSVVSIAPKGFRTAGC